MFRGAADKAALAFGSKSEVGVYLQTSMELMVIELGNLLQPMQADYSAYQGRVTHSWLKTLWEKAHKFCMQIVTAPLELLFPWEKQRVDNGLVQGGRLLRQRPAQAKQGSVPSASALLVRCDGHWGDGD